MRRLKSCSSVSLLFFFCVGISISYAANDTLRFGESMTNGSFLESSNKIFQLVFFSYDSLEQRYLGIQHMQIPDLNNNGKQRMVWVANRNNPSSINSSSNLTITQDGNLVINDHDIGIYVTLNSGNPATSIANASVTLLDSGNLVFRDGETTVWQSFDYPSDTWLPGMKLGLFDMNDTTGGKPPRQQFLTSWVSPKVPTPGDFTLGIDPSNTKQLVVWQRGIIYWSSGLWNGYNFTYFPHWRNWDANLESNFSYFSDERESYFNNSRTINNFAISIGMDSSGEIYIFKSYPPRGLVHDGILRCEAPLVEERSEGCIKITTTADKVLDRPRRKLWLIIGGPCATLLVLPALSLFCYLRWGKWLFRGAINDLSHDAKKQELIGKDHELPLFDFSSIQFATDQFSDANKIGQGGFGPVYKGKLVGGQEIAVKRLSRSSGQGLEEFKNEVILISKLQHRNLVKLLGCCTHGDERILVYEYLQNKSLDSFLFDATKRALLDWKLRVCIIEGIAQGLIYLHKYSRLKIIHRDLKASNVLLDNDMNPKISDFGTARIFRENESRANTIRIVGTYGYMSPEYAMDGLFSEKSDVFSFGVMMLEIISGEKNTGFYQPDRCLNLLGYAWDLWKEGRGVELMDQELVETCPTSEVFMRYIQVGLLCVQESAADRPVMSNVMSMLSNEMMVLPAPKKPAFSNIVCTMNYSTSSEAPYPCSKNEITISEVQAR